jgi:hypothetical protein
MKTAVFNLNFKKATKKTESTILISSKIGLRKRKPLNHNQFDSTWRYNYERYNFTVVANSLKNLKKLIVHSRYQLKNKTPKIKKLKPKRKIQTATINSLASIKQKEK